MVLDVGYAAHHRDDHLGGVLSALQSLGGCVFVGEEGTGLAGVDPEDIGCDSAFDGAVDLAFGSHVGSAGKGGIKSADGVGKGHRGLVGNGGAENGGNFFERSLAGDLFCNFSLLGSGQLAGVKPLADGRSNLFERSDALVIGLLHGCHKEVVVVHGDDVGSLSNLGVECPAGNLLGLVDGAVGGSALVDVHHVRVNAEGVDGLLVTLVAVIGESREAVGLGIVVVESLLGRDGRLLEDGDLLLEHGSGLPGDHDDMGTVLGVNHIGFTYLCGDDALEAGDHVGLGHPADVAEFTVGLGTLVGRELGCEGREVATLPDNAHEAVSDGLLIGAEKDVPHVYGVGNRSGIENPYGIEDIVVVLDDGGNTGAPAAKHEVVDLGIDGVELAGLVPVVAELALGVLQEEGLHVVGGGELVVDLGDFLVGESDVVLGRGNLEHYVFDVPVGPLLVEIGVGLVVCLDFGGGDHDGAVLHERIAHGDIVDVGGGVVHGNGLGLLKRVLIGRSGEEVAVLGIVLLAVDSVLQIVPVGLETAGLVLRDGVLDEVHNGLRVETLGAGERLEDNRGRIVAGGEVEHFGLADGDACILSVLDEHVLVYQALPGGVADLLELLLVVCGGAADDFVDVGETLHILGVVGIAYSPACDLANVIFAGHSLQGGLQCARVYNKRQKGQRDDDRNRKAELNTDFFKYRHNIV